VDDRSTGDIDDGETYVDTLMYGIRMLCRYGDRDDVAEARRVCALLDQLVIEKHKWPALTSTNANIARGTLFWREANLGVVSCPRTRS
jgi:hypothetical protein